MKIMRNYKFGDLRRGVLLDGEGSIEPNYVNLVKYNSNMIYCKNGHFIAVGQAGAEIILIAMENSLCIAQKNTSVVSGRGGTGVELGGYHEICRDGMSLSVERYLANDYDINMYVGNQ